MKANAELLVREVKERLSQRGEKYYLVDLIEDTGIPNPAGGTWSRTWANCYMPVEAGQENPKALEGYKVPVIANFYPVTKTVGDKSYDEIKVNIVKLGA
jgi:uncharacterized membrane protein